MSKKICGVYKIVSPTNRVYIGSSRNINKRWTIYNNILCKTQPVLYNSLRKHGVKNHSFSILIECKYKDMFYYERCFGELYRAIRERGGLNLSLPGYDDIPALISDTTRKKYKEVAIKHWENNEIKRKKVSEKTKIQFSDPNQRKKVSEGLKLFYKNNPNYRKMSRDRLAKLKSENPYKIGFQNKKVINVLTNEIYDSPSMLVPILNMTLKQIYNRLGGFTNNKTPYRYI